MRILAIDPATKLGWATNTEGGQIITGLLDLSGNRFDTHGMRFLRFREWLAEVVTGKALLTGVIDPIGLVVYEEVRNHVQRNPKTGRQWYATDAAHFYGGLQAILLAFCEENEMACEAMPVGTWKKHLTGKGNASKALVLKCANTMVSNRVGRDVELTQDEADAAGILLAAMRIHRATEETG